MTIPMGMIRATRKDGYGRPVDVFINPLQVMFITGYYDRTIVMLNNGRSLDVCESVETIKKAWSNIMKHAVEVAELSDLS